MRGRCYVCDRDWIGGRRTCHRCGTVCSVGCKPPAVHFERPPRPLFLSKLREGHNGTCSSKTSGGTVWCSVVRAEQRLRLSPILMQTARCSCDLLQNATSGHPRSCLDYQSLSANPSVSPLANPLPSPCTTPLAIHFANPEATPVANPLACP